MTTTTERRVAKLTFEEGKYVARYNGRLLAKSFNKEYVVEKIRTRDCARAIELGVYDVEEESHMTTEGVNPEILEEEDAIEFDINTRFEFLESLVKMIVQKNIPSLLITGEGGLGKTFTVKKVVSEAGLDDVANHMEEQRQELLNFEAAMAEYEAALKQYEKVTKKANPSGLGEMEAPSSLKLRICITRATSSSSRAIPLRRLSIAFFTKTAPRSVSSMTATPFKRMPTLST